jgi:hypothetical protein
MIGTGAALIAGALFGGFGEILGVDEDVALPAALAVGALLGAVVTVVYWRRLDEAAREAHKSAWLWGGGGGLLLAFLALPALLLAPELPSGLPRFSERDDPAGWLVNGVALVFLLQTAGYVAAWLVWWARKR